MAGPSAFALRATADKSRWRCAPARDEAASGPHTAPPQGRIRCKEQRIYSPFTSVAASPLAMRSALLEMKRAAPRRPMWLLSPAARWRETCRPHAMARHCECRAQFQLWIFSYTTRAPSSKKRVSRVRIAPGACTALTPERPSASQDIAFADEPNKLQPSPLPPALSAGQRIRMDALHQPVPQPPSQ